MIENPGITEDTETEGGRAAPPAGLPEGQTEDLLRQDSRPFSELIPGDTVRIRRGKAWELASIRNADVHPQSYQVDQGGGTLRRNRRSLLKTSESAPVAESFDGDPVHQQRPPVEPQLPSVEPQTTHIANTQTAAVMPDAAQYRTWSGRAMKTPARFQDFV